MKSRVLASRYARAMFDLGGEEKSVERFGLELGHLRRAFQMEPNLLKLLALRELKTEKKDEMLKRLCQKLMLSPAVVNLLKLLLKRRRIEMVPAIAEVFEEMVQRSENRLQAKITAADQKSVEALKEPLKKSLEKMTGKKVEFEIEEKPSLLGGFQVCVGDAIYDASLSGELQRLREATWR